MASFEEVQVERVNIKSEYPGTSTGTRALYLSSTRQSFS